MRGSIPRISLASCLLLVAGTDAFAPPSRSTAKIAERKQHVSSEHSIGNGGLGFCHYASSTSDDDCIEIHDVNRSRRLRIKTLAQRKSKPVSLAIATVTTLLSGLPGQSIFKPLPAQASAPIVLREKLAKDDPPMVQAMTKAKDLKKKKSMEEFDAFMQKCNDIEDKEGKKARDAYEKQYQTDKETAAAQKAIDLDKMKRDLLDEGKDPNTYLDAEREVFLFEHDIDLAKVPGTPHNEQMIKNFRAKGKNQPKYDNQIYIVKCQVADLKARGVDPLEHFSQSDVKDKTRAIYYKMKNAEAVKIKKQYEELMEEYGGRLSPAQEGEVPFVRPGSDAKSTGTSKKQDSTGKVAAREKRIAEKAAAKVKRAAEKEAARIERDAQKQARAEEKAKAKVDALAEKQSAKEQAKKATSVAAATSSTHMSSDSEIAATAGMDVSATAGLEAGTHSLVGDTTSTKTTKSSSDLMTSIKQYATKGNIAKLLVVGGAASYGVNYIKENNPAAKAERQRQLELLLGMTDDDEDEDEDEFDEKDDNGDYSDLGSIDQQENTEILPVIEQKPSPPPEPKVEIPKPKKKKSRTPAPEPSKPKKKFGFFKKKNVNDRETDIDALISADAEAPEFASLLAKVLTFGAPGRFPTIATMGDMPFDEFDLDKAKEMLITSRTNLDLTDEQSAEVFANVVNCMIIDIVDLANGALKAKEKDDKLAVDAINVVMDFCDHAASLFDAVAKDVEIKPVTYGGTVRKKDLEQMFSKYAGSSMMSVIGGGASQDRVDTLQIILGISDKKAEGLMQKHMMKMMMNLMKDGGKGLEGLEGMPGMEGMEDMMKAMGGEGGGIEEMMKAMGGGMEGMDGILPGMGGEMSPEDLKQTVKMMKDLLDSGQVSQDELTDIRKQFKDMYGSDIGELIKQADQEGAGASMGGDEKELLDMFKRILGE